MMANCKSTYFHCCLDVRGALRWSDSELQGKFIHQGRAVTPLAARTWLVIQLMKGRQVIPFTGCSNFDDSGRGCLGHSVEEYTNHV